MSDGNNRNVDTVTLHQVDAVKFLRGLIRDIESGTADVPSFSLVYEYDCGPSLRKDPGCNYGLVMERGVDINIQIRLRGGPIAFLDALEEASGGEKEEPSLRRIK